MIDFNKSFESDLVLVRSMTIGDYEELSRLTDDPAMWTYFTSDLADKAELKRWVETGVKDEARLALAIIDKKTTRLIGSTSIGNISSRDKRAEIGWTWISKEYQGKGYNAEVKRLLITYLFEDCELERVELKTDILNMSARKAMTKIGLVEEGVLRSHTQMIRNRRRDTIYYSVLKGEWATMKTKNNWS